MRLAQVYEQYLEPVLGVLGGIVTVAIILKGLCDIFQWCRINNLPYWDKAEIKDFRRIFIRTKSQESSPNQFHEMAESVGNISRMDLIDFFMDDAFTTPASRQRFYLVLGDAGMGKTTFLVNLYWKFRRRHLLSPKIVLIPFGRPDIVDEIRNKVRKVEQPGTVLLLDAYDEDKEAALNPDRLDEILRATENFYKVVITCRTQFFSSLRDEPYTTGTSNRGGARGLNVFVKKYISPFSNAEVNEFIRKKFHWTQKRLRQHARRIVQVCPNLMVRPLLLGYIDYLLLSTRPMTTVSSIYSELINQWIYREASRYPSRDFEGIQWKLHDFSVKIARHIYEYDVTSGVFPYLKWRSLPGVMK